MEEVMTETVTAAPTLPTQTWLFGIPTMEFATGALAIISFFALLGAFWYATEAYRSRRTMQNQLLEMQQQHLDQFDMTIVPVEWLGNYQIEISNLGPGPAKDITVRAVQDPRVRRCLEGSEFGLVVGQRRVVELKDVPTFEDSEAWENWVDPACMRVEIQASTVLGKVVKTEKMLIHERKVRLV